MILDIPGGSSVFPRVLAEEEEGRRESEKET